ncbi:MAG TPA: helix-turn-helix transcriptional regulator [Firmicutes bacterium]|nr:helix-turn-helix transcriptional regulator [Bacillota bacterium]
MNTKTGPVSIASKIGRKIDQARGSLSYIDFSKAIEQATGTSIHFTTLQKYVTGQRLPSFDNLAAIAAYSGKPLGWFLGEYDEDEKDTGVDGTASKPGVGANKEDRKIRELRAEFIARKFIALAEEMRIRMEDLGKLFDVFSELCRRIAHLSKIDGDPADGGMAKPGEVDLNAKDTREDTNHE